MKRFLYIFLLVSISSFAQKPEQKHDFSSLYKIDTEVKPSDPDWVHFLYEDNPNFFKIQNSYNKYHSQNTFEKGIHTQNYKYFMQKVYDKMEILENGYLAFSPQSSNALNLSIPTIDGWKNIGPNRTYQEGTTQLKSRQVNIYCIDYSKTNENKMLVGVSAGLIYITTDKGQTWNSIGSEYLDAGSITTVKFDPLNEDIIYAGGGNKLYKSIDGGVTWTEILNISNLKIRHLAIDYITPNILYIAANKGLYKSEDSGLTWTQLNSNKHWDVKINPLNHKAVYTLRSDPTKNFSEFWKSTNSGVSFVLKSMGWYNPALAVQEYGGRIAVTEVDTNRIYTVLLANDNDAYQDAGFAGIYRSNDAGESWYLPYDGNADGIPSNQTGGPYSADQWCFSGSSTNGAGTGYHQGYYNLAISVSSTNPDNLMVGFLNLFGSSDGGETYQAYGGYTTSVPVDYYQHADIQDITFHDNKFYVSSDGGLDTYDSIFTYIEPNINGIVGSNYWGFDNGWNRDIIVGGRYHNGNSIHLDNYGKGNFISISYGEYATGYVNIGNERVAHHSDISAKLAPLTLDGEVISLRKYTKFPNESYYQHGSSEIIIDPRYFDHFYLGKDNKLWKTEDGGNTFNLVKEFGSIESNTVTQLEISREDPNIIFVAQKDKLWRTLDQGLNWTQMALPSSSSYVSISINADDVLFLGFNTSSAAAGKIYKSVDLGNTWQNLTTTKLTNSKVDYIAVQEGTNNGVYIGSAKELWYRDDIMPDWLNLRTGLPLSTNVKKIKPFYKKNVLRMSTNMGIWEKELEGNSQPIAQPITKTDKMYCTRDTILFDSYSVAEDSNIVYEWTFPGASYISSIYDRNPKVLYDQIGYYSAKLKVTNYLGTDSKIIPNMIHVVENYCRPDSNAENSLNSEESKIELANEFPYNQNNQEFSLSMWLKPNGILEFYTYLLSFESYHNKYSDYDIVCHNDNEVRFRWNYDGFSGLEPTNLHLKPNEWNYLALTVSTDSMVLYVNDKKKVVPLTTPKNLYLKSYILGASDWGGINYDGEFDEVKMWTRALSENEIKLKRHLTVPNPNTETDMLCYYQFNDWGNLIYDKVNSNNLIVPNNVSLVPSSLPVGAGISEKKTVSTASLQNFYSTNCDIGFDSNGLNSKSHFVVSKLSTQPYEKPSNHSLHTDYWIVNGYDTYSDPKINSILFKNIDNLEDLDSNEVSLWNRNENNGDYTDWSDISSEFSIFPPIIQAYGLQHQNTGQFYLGTTIDNLSIENDKAIKKSLQLYPNPVENSQNLNLVNAKGQVSISIYDIKGKLITFLSSKEALVQIPISNNYKTGTYFISIESKTTIENSTFIVK